MLEQKEKRNIVMSKRNENIDMLRFVAICFVVCVHYVGWGGSIC